MVEYEDRPQNHKVAAKKFTIIQGWVSRLYKAIGHRSHRGGRKAPHVIGAFASWATSPGAQALRAHHAALDDGPWPSSPLVLKKHPMIFSDFIEDFLFGDFFLPKLQKNNKK